MFPEELVRKSWNECGYPPEDMLGKTNETKIVPYSSEQTRILVEIICGPESRTNFDRIECGADPHFPESDDDIVDEVELNFD